MPTMRCAWAVDASATRANRISQDREKEQNSRSDDSRHLEGCKCGLEFSGVLGFITTFPCCLPCVELTNRNRTRPDVNRKTLRSLWGVSLSGFSLWGVPPTPLSGWPWLNWERGKSWLCDPLPRREAHRLPGWGTKARRRTATSLQATVAARLRKAGPGRQSPFVVAQADQEPDEQQGQPAMK